MLFYLVISEPEQEVDPTAELKFFEWMKYLKKSNRVMEYWALKKKSGLAAILRLNFDTELDDTLNDWRNRVPSNFTVEPLKSPKALEADLAKKLLG